MVAQHRIIVDTPENAFPASREKYGVKNVRLSKKILRVADVILGEYAYSFMKT